MDPATLVEDLNARLAKYMAVLKSAEEEGNSSKTRRYKRIIAQYTSAIKSVKAGNVSAINELPSPPGFPPLINSPADTSESDMLDVGDVGTALPTPEPSPVPPRRPSAQPTVVVDESPDTPTNVVEELEQRLDKYLTVLKSAEEENSGAKVRRYKRIVDQYKSAIAQTKAGKPVELGELPNPPGFAPLVPPSSPVPTPEPSPLPVRARQPSPLPLRAAEALRPAPPPPSRVVTLAEKNTILLKDRQKEYRDAAVAAKKEGQIEEAKEFFKIYKGFDRLIQASESGLRVDLTTIPVSLKSSAQVEQSFHMVSDADFSENSNSDVFEMIKTQLTEQIKTCMQRRAHLKETGDVANANRFEQWALTFKKDLNKVLMYQSSLQAVPKFHFEQKSFPIVQCFSEIPAGMVELNIVQAVNLSKVVDSYVGYEFPYPTDSSPSGYTGVVKNSASPCYNATVTFPIDRDSKPCQRMFKRHGIKLEVWSKGGLFHRDSSLGTVVVKLLPLSNDIMIHDAFDLMNGRRPAGGKIEVKIRVREPILTKKIETITEKWLILE